MHVECECACELHYIQAQSDFRDTFAEVLLKEWKRLSGSKKKKWEEQAHTITDTEFSALLDEEWEKKASKHHSSDEEWEKKENKREFGTTFGSDAAAVTVTVVISTAAAGNSNGTKEENWKKHERKLADKFVEVELEGIKLSSKEKRISVKDETAWKLMLKARFAGRCDASGGHVPPLTTRNLGL